MADEQLLCIACEVPMEPGFIADMSHGTILQSRWCGGEPQAGWLGGEVSGKQHKAGLKITVYRCPTCGRLEPYAIQPPPKADGFED